MDWLSRIYGYDTEELRPAFDTGGFLELRADPKLMIAVNNFEQFPVDVNHASERELLRVPGVGPLAANRIVKQRAQHTITQRQELQAMGVVLKRAMPFLRFPGHKPAPAKQGELALFPPSRHSREGGNPAAPSSRRTVELHAAHAASGCASCPLNPGTCGMAA